MDNKLQDISKGEIDVFFKKSMILKNKFVKHCTDMNETVNAPYTN